MTAERLKLVLVYAHALNEAVSVPRIVQRLHGMIVNNVKYADE